MKHRAGSILALAALLAGADLGACGDKFLVVGRGTRFQRPDETSQAVAIVIYAPRASSLGDGPRILSVERALARGGYHSATAATAGDLTGLLALGKPAVVLADIADAQSVERQLGGGSTGSIVLPFLSDTTRAAVVAARKAWGGAVKFSASPDSVLGAVDDAVSRVARARGASGPKS